jgi:radical SAM-linked protein
MNTVETNAVAIAQDQNNPNTLSLRHRITFATEKTLAFVSVLELASIWERSLRRAGIPLRYSQGFHPRPKMNFAAPLPVGCGSMADLLDIWLEEALDPADIFSALHNRTPVNLHVIDITPVNRGERTLAERLESAEYIVWLHDVSRDELTSKINHLLATDTVFLPRRGRKYRGKTYDLRPLILDLHVTVDTLHSWIKVWMHLKAQPGATGRPDEVLKALEMTDCLQRCSRSHLILTPQE